MGWALEHESHDIVHGDAVHQGMQALYKAHAIHGDYNAGYDDAIKAYIKRFSERFHPDDWWDLGAKSPEGAMLCFREYAAEYHDDAFKLIGSEIYGEVPLEGSRKLLGKLDLLIEEPDGSIVVVDHKTSKNSITSIAVDEFSSSFQFNTYNLLGLTYCLSRGIPPERFKGVMVNHLVFKQSAKLGINCEFNRFYVRKTAEQLNTFIAEADYIISQIEAETAKLRKLKDINEPLVQFPKNPKNCTAYFRRCEYYDICHNHPNPLKFARQEPPAGFKISFWDPRGTKEGKKKEL